MTTKKKIRLLSGEIVYDALSEIEAISKAASFGELVRSLRQCDGLTQTELASKLGISKQHLSAIENSKKFVSVSRAAEFAEALGYPVDQFVVAAFEDEIREAGLDLVVDFKAIVNG